MFSQIKDIKHIKWEFQSCPRGEILSTGGAQVVKKKNFFEYGQMAHQTDRNGEHNRMQTKFSSHGQTGQFKYHSSVTKAISNIFIPNHVYVLPNKRLTFKTEF